MVTPLPQPGFGTLPFVAGNDPKGVIGGLQAGYNWQTDKFVYGLEADISAADIKSSLLTLLLGPVAGQDAVSTKLDWLATFRARAGITLADRLLVYVTGGLAVGQEQYAGTYAVVPNGVYYLAPNQSSTRAGWTIGGGGEWAFANNWSIKGEYLYYDLGSATSDVQSLQTNPMFHVVQNYTFNGHIVRIGVNYKFGGPVVAKY